MSWGSGPTYTGDMGGGLWMVSSHTKQPKVAAAMANWLATNYKSQGIAPTYPAYTPDATKWIAAADGSGYYAQPLAAVFAQAAKEIWPGWSPVRYSTDAAFSANITPALTSGSSLAKELPAYATALKNNAQVDGYTVKSN